MHWRSVVAEPASLTRVPGRQSVFGAHAVEAFWSLSHVAPPQSTLAAVPPAQYVPMVQGEQTAGDTGVGAAVWTVPAAQLPPGRHAERFGSLVWVPAGQG